MRDGRRNGSRRIEDYALIGDCQTAALVHRCGSVDWLCWPRFDSGACLAALLGGPEHGRWLIAPKDPNARIARRYLDGSLVLVTTFETAEGAVELVDFMPPGDGVSDLVRLVRGLRGRVELHTELILRFEYGSVVPWVEHLDDGSGLEAVAGPDKVALRTPLDLHGKDFTTVGEFAVAKGEVVPFVMSHGPSHEGARRGAGAPRHRGLLGRMVGPLRGGRPVERGGQTVPDDPEGAHLRTHRRHRRGADHVAA
jgi:GH15 family glucan-1,4-alpha-glucosidase